MESNIEQSVIRALLLSWIQCRLFVCSSSSGVLWRAVVCLQKSALMTDQGPRHATVVNGYNQDSILLKYFCLVCCLSCLSQVPLDLR